MSTSIKDDVIADFMDSIATFEGEFQNYPQDVGNWVTVNGTRKLIGTMRGVTPAALALHRAIPVETVTVEIIKSVTLQEAAEIGYMNYYLRPGFDKLPYNEFTYSHVDSGWGSGPITAIKYMQRLLGTAADGVIGPMTQKAYDDFLEQYGLAEALRLYVQQRVAFFESIVAAHPDNAIFLKGWKRRAYSRLPENLGMPLDWHGYPEDLWEPGRPIISSAKSWEHQVQEPLDQPELNTAPQLTPAPVVAIKRQKGFLGRLMDFM